MVQYNPQYVKPLYRTHAKAARKGLTLRMILDASQRTNEWIQPNRIRVQSYKKVTDVYGQPAYGYRFRVVDRKSPRQPPVEHMAYVWAHNPLHSGPLSDRGVNIKVSCDCEAFLYRSEYALTYYQASVIHFCNGQPPNTTNPGLIPFACKHIQIVLESMQKRGL